LSILVESDRLIKGDLVRPGCNTLKANAITFILRVTMPFSTFTLSSAHKDSRSASLRPFEGPSPSSRWLRKHGEVNLYTHERVKPEPFGVTCRYRPVLGPSAWYPGADSFSTCLAVKAFAATLPTNHPPSILLLHLGFLVQTRLFFAVNHVDTRLVRSLKGAIIKVSIEIKRGQSNSTKSPILRPHRTPPTPNSVMGPLARGCTLFCSNDFLNSAVDRQIR